MAYITKSGSELRLDGQRFRFVGVNYYPFSVSTTAEATMDDLFKAMRARQIRICRTWAFDAGKPPSNSAGNLRYLRYAEGTNLITNYSFESGTDDWTLGTGFSRVNEDAQDGSWSIKQVTASGYERLSIPITVTTSTDYVLTFRYKMTVNSSFAPVCFIGTSAGSNNVKDGGFSSATGGEWVEKQVTFNSGANTTLYIAFQNWNGNVVGYYDNINVSVQSTAELAHREASYVQLDKVLDYARQHGVKMVLSLADNTTNYNTKQTYVTWANSIYDSGLSTSSPYVGFFDADDCRTLFKANFATLANRVNTINGRTYKNDDTIAWWELGNELRYDVFDSEGGTQNTVNSTNIVKVMDWADEIAGYIKSVDTNHLVSFSSVAHTWQWTNGDTVSNGSGYGVDYDLFGSLTYVDILDFHCYPTQGGTELLKYGQRLISAANAPNAAGYIAQLQDYVSVIQGNDKVCICGEIGFDKDVINSNLYIRHHPRVEAFRIALDTMYDAGIEGVILWSATLTSGGSYSVVLEGFNGTYTNASSDDRPIMQYLVRRLYKNKRIPVAANG